MKHLMILRCGKNSLHKAWIHHIRKIMDIAFVYFDDSDFSNDKPTYSYFVEGTKLSGAHDFIVNHPKIIEQYDYFWIFDDDIHIPYQSAKGIIDFIKKYKPTLCAPSLTQDSYFTHPMTLQQPSLFLRGTDFVEVMVPIMSKKFLKDTTDQMKEFPMWGIERYWQYLLWEHQEIAFIFDQWPVIHTRPVGTGSIYKMAEKLKINVLGDDAKSIELYGKKFNNSPTNILFGLTNETMPTFLTASKLRSYLSRSHHTLNELYGESTHHITNDILNRTNYQNTLFSQFLSFPTVQKLLTIDNITPEASNMMVREWAFGNKNQPQPWTRNMVFGMDGRIQNYYNKNEHYWEIIDGIFHIFSIDRKTYTAFDKTEVINNKIVLTGKFSGSNHPIHYLEENKAFF